MSLPSNQDIPFSDHFEKASLDITPTTNHLKCIANLEQHFRLSYEFLSMRHRRPQIGKNFPDLAAVATAKDPQSACVLCHLTFLCCLVSPANERLRSRVGALTDGEQQVIFDLFASELQNTDTDQNLHLAYCSKDVRLAYENDLERAANLSNQQEQDIKRCQQELDRWNRRSKSDAERIKNLEEALDDLRDRLEKTDAAKMLTHRKSLKENEKNLRNDLRQRETEMASLSRQIKQHSVQHGQLSDDLRRQRAAAERRSQEQDDVIKDLRQHITSITNIATATTQSLQDDSSSYKGSPSPVRMDPCDGNLMDTLANEFGSLRVGLLDGSMPETPPVEFGSPIRVNTAQEAGHSAEDLGVHVPGSNPHQNWRADLTEMSLSIPPSVPNWLELFD
ncbi:hypothetical protein CYLTODRAFT_414598 [Cylindrobasidium torrendii FP15055 ss-10]|uniref:Uncharacterized protein n=1 Tax=Cylindrobasidium torrendii FP15055 ss-10 TaxID=1314674 RepID=A0A0D7AXB2_9AGAR|nr:hypothetical protein CYLTODRAFT_414598 [Cylindrobasidium torrendii FP15055 ss-10]